MHTNGTASAEDRTHISAKRILFICFLVIVLDGLDTTSIAFVIPLLSKTWGLPPQALTAALVATSLGAVIGYMASGPLAQKLGSKAVGIGSVLIFGVGTLLTAMAWDVMSLSLLRFVSAIGLGGVLPVAVATAANAMPERHRETAAMLVATGISAGAVVGGLIGAPLMQRFGWSSIFWLGGILPLLILPFFMRILSDESPAEKKSQAGSVGALFKDGLAAATLLLWAFAFMIFLVTYGMNFWIPTLLGSFGFSPAQAPLGAAAMGMGGLVGNLLMMTVIRRLGMKTVLVLTTLFASACILIISFADLQASMVLPVLAGVGAGLITGCVGQSALAVSFYPPALRTTGVGWSAAMGRLGSIVGPAVGGALLALGWPSREIILVALVPAMLAILVLVILGAATRSRTAAGAGVQPTT